MPLPRRRGICPLPRNNHDVRQSSKYSALATNVIGRGATSRRKIGSVNDRWLGAMTTAPERGRFSSPLTSIRYRDRRSGLKVSLAIWVTVRSSMSFPLLQRRVRVATGGQVLALVGQGLKGAGG